MAPPPSPQSLARVELGPGPTLFVVVGVIAALGIGAAWGWSLAGPLGGLLGTLLGSAIGVLLFTFVRLWIEAKRLAERPAPDVRALPPDQALQVLGAIMSAGSESAGLSLDSGLLAELAKVRKMVDQGDPVGALTKLDELARSHPRSPAVPAERARVLRGRGQPGEATQAAGLAITIALHGGMNRIAVQVFGELDDSDRTNLDLSADHWRALGRALRASGDQEGAERWAGYGERPGTALPNDSERGGFSP